MDEKITSELTDKQIKELLEKYDGKGVICPKCYCSGKISLRFGYAICVHGKTKQCFIGSCENEGVLELLDLMIKRGLRR